MENLCPICGKEMEDTRHVGVECFYDVHEVVPDAVKSVIFKEVDEGTTYWGVTRHYPEGTKDNHFVESEGKTEAGFKTTKIGIKQDPIPKIRLLEDSLFSVTCCKSCRADFLWIFGQWAKGELVDFEKSITNLLKEASKYRK
jgi:hypothetical protein